ARDGKSIYYLSDAGNKDETTQLWRMSASGGRDRRVTDIPGGVSDFDLAPDGKRAIVVAEVGGTVGNKAETTPPIETTRFQFKVDGEGYLDDRTQQLFMVDLATGKARQLTGGLRDHWHPAWAPDGLSVAYTAKERGDTDRDSNFEVFVQHVGGARRRSRLARTTVVVAGLAAPAVARRRRQQVDLLCERAARDCRRRERRDHPACAHRSLVLFPEIRAGRFDTLADRTGPRHLAGAHRSR